MCFGIKRSWWDVLSLAVVPATAMVYLLAPLSLRFGVFVLQACLVPG